MSEMEESSNSLVDFFSQWQENTKAFREMIKAIQNRMEEPVLPVLDIRKRVEEAMKPWSELREKMDEAMEPWRQVWQKLSKDFSYITSKAREFEANLNSFIGTVLPGLVKEFQKLPKRTQDALVALGTRGWYLDLEMTLPGLWSLQKAIVEGNSDEAERALTEYFRENTRHIEEDLINLFPHRAKILSSAFSAHLRGEYELSVPVFLAQSDGICQELIGIQLFRKRGNVPAIAEYVETLAGDTFQAALLYPLCVTLPISASQHERSNSFIGLNRHQVLHGESTQYGNEINSLKAISLLNYVSHALKVRKDETKNDNNNQSEGGEGKKI